MTQPTRPGIEIPSAPAPPELRGPATPRIRWLVGGVTAGVAVGLLAAILSAFFFLRNDVPDVTVEAVDVAEARWRAAALPGYAMDLKLEGRQPGRVHIEVRGGEVVAMTRDGQTPSQRRTWDYWTVPGQFDTIRQDLESAQDPAQGFGAPAGARVILRAEFDRLLGYPRKYQRYVLGTPLDVEWQVERFERLE